MPDNARPSGWFSGPSAGFWRHQTAHFSTPDQAFSLDVIVRDPQTLLANFRVTPGYYLYRDKVTFETDDKTIKIVALNLPRGDMKEDPNFGTMEVFHQSFQAEIALERGTATKATGFSLKASYQGCSEQGLCYPPITPTLTVSLPDVNTGQLPPPVISEAPVASPPAVDTESAQIARLFKGGNFWLIISFFFGAACCYL